MPLFYLPPIRNQRGLPLNPEWLILLLGLLVLLATTVMVYQFVPRHRPMILPDWAVAQAEPVLQADRGVRAIPRLQPQTLRPAERILQEQPDDLGVATHQPRPILRLRVAMTNPVQTSTRLRGTATTSGLESAIEQVLRNQDNQGHILNRASEIPNGTHLLGLWQTGNTITVNLSQAFNTGGGATSMLGRVAELRQTVKRINPNYRLKIAIEGKPVPYLGGEGLELE